MIGRVEVEQESTDGVLEEIVVVGDEWELRQMCLLFMQAAADGLAEAERDGLRLRIERVE
jgi:hypothetical protein